MLIRRVSLEIEDAMGTEMIICLNTVCTVGIQSNLLLVLFIDLKIG